MKLSLPAFKAFPLTSDAFMKEKTLESWSCAETVFNELRFLSRCAPLKLSLLDGKPSSYRRRCESSSTE